MRRLAILDMYAGKENEGMRCIRALAAEAGLQVAEYDVRLKRELPKLDEFDLVISSGGPGDPWDVLASEWGTDFCEWLQRLVAWNRSEREKKPCFMICHSFQMTCLALGVAEVTLRHKPAFGIYPVAQTESGYKDPIVGQLGEPFWIVDSRDYQVVKPNFEQMRDLGAQVLAIEKERAHVPLERAAMCIRFTKEIIGTQFHPEADLQSLRAYLQDPAKRAKLLEIHGEDRLLRTEAYMLDPSGVIVTNRIMIPTFLRQAVLV